MGYIWVEHSFDRPYNLQDMGLPSIFIGLILIAYVSFGEIFPERVNLASDWSYRLWAHVIRS
jgi:hypothetical protein